MSEKDNEKEEALGFKITDRRHFTEEGELREGVEDSPPEPTPTLGAESSMDVPKERPSQRPKDGIDFSSFLLSMATSAMVQMGEIPDPATGTAQANLEGAKQVVEILALLQEKTRGNLTSKEAELLENLLYELRMVFVSKTKSGKR